jgi:hypothetical protein
MPINYNTKLGKGTHMRMNYGCSISYFKESCIWYAALKHTEKGLLLTGTGKRKEKALKDLEYQLMEAGFSSREYLPEQTEPPPAQEQTP